MARRKRVEEHVNHERWLVPYADFITLLFAFFVVMYSISSVNVGKFRILSDSLEAVFSEPKKSVVPIQIGELSRSNDEKEKIIDPRPEPEQLIELPVAPIVPEETIRTINDISNQLNDALLEQIENQDVSLKKARIG